MHAIGILALASIGSTLIASNASALRFTDASYLLPKGVVGKPYVHVFELAKGGGSPPYHYKMASDGTLPPGLTLSQEDGKVTGTPLAAGKWSIWLHGIDSGLQQGFWDMQTERQFTFEILPALSIRQQSLEPAVLNRHFTVKLSAVGGGTQAWSIVSGTLPRGLNLASDGTLSGTASNAGHFNFVVKVTDPVWDDYTVRTRKHMAGFRSDTRTLVLWVAKVSIELPEKIPPLEIGRPMPEAKLTATGGVAPYKWALSGPVKLPAGLTLDAQGTIRGTPQTPGAFLLVISVKDANGSVGVARMPIEVQPAGNRK